MLSRDPHVVRLMDVKQGQNKEGKTVLYLVFEYMDTDLKKFIRSFRQSGETIPPHIIKVILSICPSIFNIRFFFVHLFLSIWLQSLMYQLCKGVAFCHGHGILHRYVVNPNSLSFLSHHPSDLNWIFNLYLGT